MQKKPPPQKKCWPHSQMWWICCFSLHLKIQSLDLTRRLDKTKQFQDVIMSIFHSCVTPKLNR